MMILFYHIFTSTRVSESGIQLDAGTQDITKVNILLLINGLGSAGLLMLFVLIPGIVDWIRNCKADRSGYNHALDWLGMLSIARQEKELMNDHRKRLNRRHVKELVVGIGKSTRHFSVFKAGDTTDEFKESIVNHPKRENTL